MIDLSLRWQVIEGKNEDFREALPRDAVIVSDPPYGMGWNVRVTAFGIENSRDDRLPIYGDDQPFDPTPWLAFPEVILFGANHYAQRLPVGTTLVWVKKHPSTLNTTFSDAEVAWQRGGCGVYVNHLPWDNLTRLRGRVEGRQGGDAWHPTQKPVALMKWCIERLDLAPDSLILDPYCGSGTTGVAAVQLGHRFIGIEREPQYVAIARQRIADAAAQGNLFDGATP